MKRVVLNVVFLSLSSGLIAQIPKVLWQYDLHDASFGQTVAADIDNDGKLELVFGCYRNDSSVYALNADDGSLLWKYNTHTTNAEGCNDVAPTVLDIDNDDSLEVIVPSSCNPITYCFNGKTGKVIWQTPTRGSDSPPTIADVDGDGKPEIIHGEFGGYVICINAENGSVAWEIAVDTKSWIQTAPTIVDIDGDSKPDFVVATWNTTDTNKVYAYRGFDQKLLWTYSLRDVVYHGTAVADLDNDNKPELVLGDYSGALYCLNAENGSLNWEYIMPQYYYVGSPATIADLDGDNSCDIVFSAWYKVVVLSSAGKLKWEYNTPDYGQSFRGAALSDIDNDRLPDVIFGTDQGDVFALKGTDKSLIWRIALDSLFGDTLSFDHAPIVADFNKDGLLDVFIVGGYTNYPDFSHNYGGAYCISAGKGYGPDWLMFQRDVQRKSSLCAASTGIEDNQDNSHSFEIFPNPNRGDFDVIMKNRLDTDGSISVYNLSLQKVFEQKLNSLGNERLEIKTNLLAPGMYIIQLSTSKLIESAKLIIY